MSGNITSYCLQLQNKNVVELSGTGVPPSLLDEVQERRSGASRGAGAAFRLVPAEIKHCAWPINYCNNSIAFPVTNNCNFWSRGNGMKLGKSRSVT